MHKPNNPIRPLVNAIGSPTYKLAKFLDKRIKSLITVTNDFSIVNSSKFANAINGHKMEGGQRMMSLDIVNLYTNIPVEEVKSILEKRLVKCKKVSKKEIKEIMKLVAIVLKQNYFTYKDKYYICDKGVAMGGPLSGTLAQIYLSDFEETKIMCKNNPYFKMIVKYFRMVDDTFFIIRGTERIGNKFVNYLNSLNQNIQFTVEFMLNKILNYLDLTIFINEVNELALKIYRKPTTTDILIPFSSNHPRQHKYAAIRSLAYRAFAIPMAEKDLQHEINVIHYLAYKNGFPAFIANKIIEQQKAMHEKRKNNQIVPETSKRKFIPITYFNHTSNDIGRIFEKWGYTPAFRTVANSQTIMKRANQEPVDKFNRAGVYKINCDTCQAAYVGKTERSVRLRFKEHLSQNSSNVYKHIVDENHVINDIDQHVDICHLTNNKKLLSTLEKFEIRREVLNNTNLLNIQLDINNAGNVLIDRCCKI